MSEVASMPPSEDDTGPIMLPGEDEIPSHVAGLILGQRNHGKRLRVLEAWGPRLAGIIATSAMAVIIAIVTAAFNLGARMETLTQLGDRLVALEQRISRLEDHRP